MSGTATPLLGVLTGLDDAHVNLEVLKAELDREFEREREVHRQVAEVAPHTIPRIESLRREQEELRRWIEGLLALLELGLAPFDAFARDRSRLLGRVRRHLCAEADLLLEAYMRDVGGH